MMALGEALQRAATWVGDMPDEDEAREVGALLNAMRLILIRKRIATISDLRTTLKVTEPVTEAK